MAAEKAAAPSAHGGACRRRAAGRVAREGGLGAACGKGAAAAGSGIWPPRPSSRHRHGKSGRLSRMAVQQRRRRQAAAAGTLRNGGGAPQTVWQMHAQMSRPKVAAPHRGRRGSGGGDEPCGGGVHGCPPGQQRQPRRTCSSRRVPPRAASAAPAGPRAAVAPRRAATAAAAAPQAPPRGNRDDGAPLPPAASEVDEAIATAEAIIDEAEDREWGSSLGVATPAPFVPHPSETVAVAAVAAPGVDAPTETAAVDMEQRQHLEHQKPATSAVVQRAEQARVEPPATTLLPDGRAADAGAVSAADTDAVARVTATTAHPSHTEPPVCASRDASSGGGVLPASASASALEPPLPVHVHAGRRV